MFGFLAGLLFGRSASRWREPGPITPFEWLGIAVYCLFAVILLAAGMAGDREALNDGLIMLGIAVAFWAVVRFRLTRLLGSALEAIGTGLGWIIVVGLWLVPLYFLVRFIKWAWMND
jgi:hypothetical protein